MPFDLSDAALAESEVWRSQTKEGWSKVNLKRAPSQTQLAHLAFSPDVASAKSGLRKRASVR